MVHQKKTFIYTFNKKREFVFLLFVLGSFIFWFLTKLSNTYTQVVPYNIVYTNLPKQFVFQEKPKENILLRIEADGFYFFSNAFKSNIIKISLKHIKKRGEYIYVLSNSDLKNQIRESIKENINLVEVVDDEVEVKLGKKSLKKVPVIPNISVDYYLGYSSFSGVEIIPDSIQISGPQMQVDKIKELQLAPIVKKELSTSINQKVSVIKPNVSKIKLDKEFVQLKLEVEKITEKTLEIPVQIINAPTQQLVLYPKKIKVICQLPLSQFNSVNPQDFTVVCDYNKRDSKYIKIDLVKKAMVISDVKLSTDRVEYLIIK